MGYKWSGFIDFTFELELPREHVDDGSLQKFVEEVTTIGADVFRFDPMKRETPALGALFPEQVTTSVFLNVRGNPAKVEEYFSMLRQLCEKHFQRAH